MQSLVYPETTKSGGLSQAWASPERNPEQSFSLHFPRRKHPAVLTKQSIQIYAKENEAKIVFPQTKEIFNLKSGGSFLLVSLVELSGEIIEFLFFLFVFSVSCLRFLAIFCF